MEEFKIFENLTLEYAKKNNLMQSDTVFTILSTHALFLRKIYTQLAKQDRVEFKIRKELKDLNENFFENYIDFLLNIKEDIKFVTAFNIVKMVRECHLTKRNNLKQFLLFYNFITRKFCKENTTLEKFKIDRYIECGFHIFLKDNLHKQLIETFKECNLDYEHCIPAMPKKNKKAKDKRKEKKQQELEDVDE